MVNPVRTPKSPFLLGDAIEKALSAINITKERVEAVLGRPCGCGWRRDMLNRLSLWAARVGRGKTEKAAEYLEEIIGETPPEEK